MLLANLFPLALAALATAETPKNDSTTPKDAEGKDAPPFLWKDPFTNPSYTSFTPSCTASKTFPAYQHTLNDLLLDPPTGLRPWHTVLKAFFRGHHYPGGWSGHDPHKFDRHVIKMEYADLPVAVQDWIDAETVKGSQKLFAVYEKPDVEGEQVAAPKTRTSEDIDEWRKIENEEKVVIFAPGAIYGILPLWVEEGSGCEDELKDLSQYTAEPKDGGVVAWVTDRRSTTTDSKERDFEFTIKAEVLRAGAVKDEL